MIAKSFIYSTSSSSSSSNSNDDNKNDQDDNDNEFDKKAELEIAKKKKLNCENVFFKKRRINRVGEKYTERNNSVISTITTDKRNRLTKQNNGDDDDDDENENENENDISWKHNRIRLNKEKSTYISQDNLFRERKIRNRLSKLSSDEEENENTFEEEESSRKEKKRKDKDLKERHREKDNSSNVNKTERVYKKNQYSSRIENNKEKILDEIWYTKEDDGFADSFYNMDKDIEEKEKKMLNNFKSRKTSSGQKVNQKNLDNNLWELNKLKQGGVYSTYNKLQLDKINEVNSTNEIKKIVLTRNLTPTFMHKFKEINENNFSKNIFNNIEKNRTNVQLNEKEGQTLSNSAFNNFENMLQRKNKNENSVISVVKDETCDFVKAAKKGSEFLKYLKSESEKSKARDRYWEIESSKLGELLKMYKKKDEMENRTNKGKTNKELDKELDKEPDIFDYKKEKIYGNIFNAENEKMKNKTNLLEKENLIKTKQSLPIYKTKQELLNAVYNNNVIIIVGETGSGKTTQIVQYLYEDGYSQNGMICCTQPRRVAAVSVAFRVAYEMNVPIGNLVGYTIRFEDVSTKHTKIRYVTDGILLRETLTDKELDKYSVIIMDEAHERSINTDVLFGILKNICLNRNDLKLIITSATLDAQKFSHFFGNAPIFYIDGRTFHVQIEYLRTPCNDYIEAAVQRAIEIHVSDNNYDNNFGDILIFMTGQDDINATCYLLSERFYQVYESYKDSKQNKQKTVGKIKSLIGTKQKQVKEIKEEIDNIEQEAIKPFYIFPIYAQLSSEQQSKIFMKYNLRKIIVSTNIAETSLTLDGIKYVIDSGYCKLKIYNQKIGMDVLQITPISQANANQRSGRAGRTGPGICYRLYTENTFLCDFYPNNIPEIQRSNLSNVVLLLKSLNVEDIFDFDFMDAPSIDSIVNSLYELWILGAINNEGNLTTLGEKMVLFPLDPPLSKIVIYSEKFHCTDEILIVVSMLSSTSIFLESRENSETVELKKENFIVPESDHLTLLNIYLQWKSHNYSHSWCDKNFLQYKSLNKAKEVYSQLNDILETLKMKNVSCNRDWDIVRKTICSGYFHNAAKLKSIGEYINLKTNVACHVHPNCSLYNIGYTPDYVVYQEIVFTTKEFMRNVTTVDPEWLCELGPMFFYMKNR